MSSISNNNAINPKESNTSTATLVNSTEKTPHKTQIFQQSLEKASSLEKTFINSISSLDQSFRSTEIKSAALVKNLPSEYKGLFELQLSVYKCNFQTEIVTKVGEAVQGAIKKLQNQAG